MALPANHFIFPADGFEYSAGLSHRVPDLVEITGWGIGVGAGGIAWTVGWDAASKTIVRSDRDRLPEGMANLVEQAMRAK